MDYLFRLTKGADLKKSIRDYCIEHRINSAVIVTCVGSLLKANLRMAKALVSKEYDDDFEIVSLTGTVCRDGLHLHMAISDENGNVYGGHVNEGCIVNTTCEICLRSLDERYNLYRQFDEESGYKELVIEEV